jgi:hypothetical protein
VIGQDIKKIGSANGIFLPLGLILLLIEVLVFVKSDGTFHDAKTLLEASELLGSRINPYTNDYFLNSYALAGPFTAFISIFPLSLAPTIWNLANGCGIFYFLNYLAKDKSWSLKIWFLVLVLAMSPSRAMFASIQHTGVILGLLTFAFHISGNSVNINKKATNIFAAVSLLIAFEFKPQSAIPVLALFLIKKDHQGIFKLWLAATVTLHLVTSYFFRMPLDLMWVERLAGRSQVTAEVNAGENSIWILASSIFAQPKFWLVVSFVAYAVSTGYLIWFNSRAGGDRNLLIIALVIPLTLSYVHTYDYLAISILAAWLFIRTEGSYFGSLATFLFLLPTVATGSDMKIRILVALAAYLLFEFYRAAAGSRVKVSSLLSVLCSSAFYFLISLIVKSENLRISILLSLSSVLAIFALRDFKIGNNKYL